jgi:hypothetical protein
MVVILVFFIVLKMGIDIVKFFNLVNLAIKKMPIPEDKIQLELNPEPFFGKRGRDGRRH